MHQRQAEHGGTVSYVVVHLVQWELVSISTAACKGWPQMICEKLCVLPEDVQQRLLSQVQHTLQMPILVLHQRVCTNPGVQSVPRAICGSGRSPGPLLLHDTLGVATGAVSCRAGREVAFLEDFPASTTEP